MAVSVEPGMAISASMDPARSHEKIRLMVTDSGHPVRHVLLAIEALGAGPGLVLAANRPAHMLRGALEQIGMDMSRTHFLDCVSSLSGMSPRPEPGIAHVESPTMLEKIAMRCEQMLRAMPEPRFLVVDSLAALSVYNGPAAVAEFTHHMVNRLRRMDVAAVFLASERQGGQTLCEAVAPLCDGVIRV